MATEPAAAASTAAPLLALATAALAEPPPEPEQEPPPALEEGALRVGVALAAATLGGLLYWHLRSRPEPEPEPEPQPAAATAAAAAAERRAAAAAQEQPEQADGAEPPDGESWPSEPLEIGDDVCGRLGCLRCYGVPQSRYFETLATTAFLSPQISPRLRPMLQAAQRGHRLLSAEPGQHPTLLFCPGLEARPWWPEQGWPWVAALLSAAPRIRKEFAALRAAAEATAQPGTKGGKWSGLYLINQGAEMAEACGACPETMAALSQAPTMRGCSLGYAFFSVLAPGTRIEPHCGASNLRLRCHVPLQLPTSGRAAMRVGTAWREWRQGECAVFDDSFEHEVAHEGSGERVVLLVDVWAPGLAQAERAALRALFPA